MEHIFIYALTYLVCVSDTTLILNGEIDVSWLEKVLLDKEDICCTDGAYNKLSKSKVNIRMVLGDFDSIEKENMLKKEVSCIYMPDQDYTDFEKAIIFLKEDHNKIVIYGASGGDVDHFLGNLSVAMKYKDEVEIIFHDSKQYYFFAKNPTELKGVKDKIISIIPFPELESVVSDSLQYPLNNDDLKLGCLISVRNFAVQDKVTISYKSGNGVIIVER